MPNTAALKTMLFELATELADTIHAKVVGDWPDRPPRMGTHYFYSEVKGLPSYRQALEELSQVPSIESKYDQDRLDKPIISFLELVVSTLPDTEFLERYFEFWWERFYEFITTDRVNISLLVGLSNFEVSQPEFIINDELSILHFGDRSLEEAVMNTTPAMVPDRFPSTSLPMHMIPGAFRVDFQQAADRATLQHAHYSHESIDRMLPISNALRLSTFGRLVIGPWLPICNPPFPVDGVRAVGSPERGSRFAEPTFTLDDQAVDRFREIYAHLLRLQDEDDRNLEYGRAIRRRFSSSIERFSSMMDKGYWEEVVVDLVILMESLLTADRGGGRMSVALSASNLLGTNQVEAMELFNNLTQMYWLRNHTVHGEPLTQDQWDTRLLEIARNAGLDATSLDNGVREYAFEVMRDYARRAITAMLNLHYEIDRGPSGSLAGDLQILHLDEDLQEEIQGAAKVYPLHARPPYVAP